jgi:hypothetical protein
MFEVLVEQRIERCKKSGKVDEGIRGQETYLFEPAEEEKAKIRRRLEGG